MEFIVKKSIAINAALPEVWDALTNPEKTKHYFFHCRVYSNWKIGTPITFKGRVFLFFPIKLSGIILKITPEKMLQYSLKNRSTSGQSVVTDELRYENGQTILTITDNVGGEEGADERYKKSMKGWDKILNGLKKFVEGRK